MGYFRNLHNSADWLVSVQNDNKGWGMSSGQASSIVNTAEAIDVLTKDGRYYLQIYEGIDFIENKLFSSIERSGTRTRYVFLLCLHCKIIGIKPIKNSQSIFSLVTTG